MKRIPILILMPVIVSMLTACGGNTTSLRGYIIQKEHTFHAAAEENDFDTTETLEENDISQIEPESEESIADTKPEVSSPTGMQECTIDNVTFSVDSSWEPIAGYNGSFAVEGGSSVYQLQGVSPLGSYTPEEFYQELLDVYAESYEITYSDDMLDAITTQDGVSCFAGRIEMTAEVLFSIDILIAPQKNTVITYALQHPEGIQPPIDIREVTKTTVFHIGTEDVITGQTFLVGDGSKLCLEENGKFRYYQTEDEANSAYCMGTYEVWYGQAAFDKVASMTDYGLTEEELEQTLTANMDSYSLGGSMPYDYFSEGASAAVGYHVCRDTFYAVILHNEKMVDGTEETDMGNDTLYIGYYLWEAETADMINTNTASYAQWELQ